MIYLKEFGTDAEYNAYITGSTAFHPNTSLIGSTDVKFEKVPDPYIMVDLGLPSGTKWCNKNLGASSETEYGDYFAWGETTPRGADWATTSPYVWAHAPFNNGSSSFDSTYFASVSGTVCPNNLLALEYDAAHVQLGGAWRMPTSGQVQELIDNTTSDWTENYQGSGISGSIFTSKTNGNAIFIPASGYRYNSHVCIVGIGAFLWSSTLDSDDPDHAYHLIFDSGGGAFFYNVRSDGFCVRPVC